MQNCVETVKKKRKKVKSILSIPHIRILIILLLFSADQLFKFLFFYREILGEKIPLIKGLLYIVPPVENPGIAFGLLRAYGHLLVIPILIAIFFVLYLYIKTKEPLFKWGLLLILSGAFSNLLDRILNHAIIDYLFLWGWPYYFNLADFYIVVGTGMITIRLLGKSLQKRVTQDKKEIPIA